MGLDMYLSAKLYTSKYSNKELNKKLWNIFEELKPSENSDSATIKFEMGYWRKANHIHKWFVDNCQEGRDECQEAYVSREDLELLKKLCEDILKDKENAGTLLSTRGGFFFGGTDYDGYYFEALNDTIEIINKCLELPEEWDFEYRSSW